jgi:hypothetical protein
VATQPEKPREESDPCCAWDRDIIATEQVFLSKEEKDRLEFQSSNYNNVIRITHGWHFPALRPGVAHPGRG